MIRRLLLLAAIALAGCGGKPPPQSVAGAACEPVTFERDTFLDCTAVPGRDRIRLVLDDRAGQHLRSLTRLKSELGPAAAARVRFALNAGMFDDKGGPIGLLVIGGTELQAINRNSGSGNFHLLPNGVFYLSGGQARISATPDYAPTNPVEYATQSGPMLVIGGQLHPALAPDGDSRYVRNAVGVDAQGTAHFVISDRPVSLGKLARLYRDRLGCANALYLDGFVSSLWDPARGRIDDNEALGPMLVVDRAD